MFSYKINFLTNQYFRRQSVRRVTDVPRIYPKLIFLIRFYELKYYPDIIRIIVIRRSTLLAYEVKTLNWWPDLDETLCGESLYSN